MRTMILAGQRYPIAEQCPARNENRRCLEDDGHLLPHRWASGAIAIRPHGHRALPSDPALRAMQAACTATEWTVISPDGSWTGPYPDQETALGFL